MVPHVQEDKRTRGGEARLRGGVGAVAGVLNPSRWLIERRRDLFQIRWWSTSSVVRHRGRSGVVKDKRKERRRAVKSRHGQGHLLTRYVLIIVFPSPPNTPPQLRKWFMERCKIRDPRC